ncbi:hypothetical protein GYMLUDRAFT_48346, partial [Collybiopsis luxurians FD-317 M1]
MYRCSGYRGPMIEPTYLISPIPSICFIDDRSLLLLRLFVVFDTGNGIIAHIIAAAAAKQLAPHPQVVGKVSRDRRSEMRFGACSEEDNVGEGDELWTAWNRIFTSLPALPPFHPPQPNLLLM